MLVFLLSVSLLITTAEFVPLRSQERYEIRCNNALLLKSEQYAKSQIGVTERTGHNDGPQISAYLKSVGINFPAAYCYAGQYWCFDQAAKDLKMKNPLPKSGMANSAFAHARKHGRKTKYIAHRHDLITWKVRKGWSGHIERIISVSENGNVQTIGFNTSKGTSGSQSNGGGVYVRYRNIYHPLSRLLRIRGLVGFYED